MKVKVSEASGPVLDWMVAQAELTREDYRDRGLLVHRIGYGQPMPPYSTDWSQGGPIIEREDINVNRHTHSEVTESGQEIYRKDGWTAFTTATAYWMTPKRQYGPTPLIAAMRAYAAYKLGDEVEVPEELK